MAAFVTPEMSSTHEFFNVMIAHCGYILADISVKVWFYLCKYITSQVWNLTKDCTNIPKDRYSSRAIFRCKFIACLPWSETWLIQFCKCMLFKRLNLRNFARHRKAKINRFRLPDLICFKCKVNFVVVY